MLAHRTKKPGCGPEILDYLRSQEETKNIKPEEIAVVGDRLMTDMLLANMMGGYGVWIKDGVVPYEKKSIVSSPGFFSTVEPLLIVVPVHQDGEVVRRISDEERV